MNWPKNKIKWKQNAFFSLSNNKNMYSEMGYLEYFFEKTILKYLDRLIFITQMDS